MYCMPVAARQRKSQPAKQGSIVLAYVALQPLTAVMWSRLLNYVPALKKCHLARPGVEFSWRSRCVGRPGLHRVRRTQGRQSEATARRLRRGRLHLLGVGRGRHAAAGGRCFAPAPGRVMSDRLVAW
jgi:hypothetical protein